MDSQEVVARLTEVAREDTVLQNKLNILKAYRLDFLAEFNDEEWTDFIHRMDFGSLRFCIACLDSCFDDYLHASEKQMLRVTLDTLDR
jgi:hypothetical protein